MTTAATGADPLAPREPAGVLPAPVAAPGRRRLRFLSNGKVATGIGLLGFFLLIAVIGSWIAPYNPSARSNTLLQGPSAKHWFGTTHLGQDLLSQVLVGTSSVMYVGLLAGVVATVLAVLIGVSSGYLSGLSAESLSAVSNVFLVIPALLLIIIITSSVPAADSGDTLVALVIGLTSWAWNARVLRAQTLSLRRRDFIEASRATGESTWRIILFELLPNLSAVIVSGFIGTVVYAIMTEITLAFIGVPGISAWNWGTILYWAQSEQALAQGAWWWFVPAGLAIALLGTSLALINFGIDEFVNPRLRNNDGSTRRLRGPDGRPVRMRVGFTPVVFRQSEEPDRTDGSVQDGSVQAGSVQTEDPVQAEDPAKADGPATSEEGNR